MFPRSPLLTSSSCHLLNTNIFTNHMLSFKGRVVTVHCNYKSSLSPVKVQMDLGLHIICMKWIYNFLKISNIQTAGAWVVDDHLTSIIERDLGVQVPVHCPTLESFHDSRSKKLYLNSSSLTGYLASPENMRGSMPTVPPTWGPWKKRIRLSIEDN